MTLRGVYACKHTSYTQYERIDLAQKEKMKVFYTFLALSAAVNSGRKVLMMLANF